ncbi:MAG TPA: hypothetical protein VMW72_15190 [Sedimentisphaerales bacterium]|nr:hypothetical protein [Sedimentisphaerales bacterium]
MTEDKNGKENNSRGGILSVVDLRGRIVPAKDVEEYLSLFEKRDWDGISKLGKDGENYEKKFVITDYNELNLTPFSYDLSIGEQVFSIQKPEQEVYELEPSANYLLEPGETVVVLTKELIAIPHAYSATVWPRFNMVRSGVFQSMVKIDPTWYGKLAVAMSNLSPAVKELKAGEAFATLLLYELSKPTDVDLWKHEDIKNIEIDVTVPPEFKESLRRLDDFLFETGDLRKFCRLEESILKVNAIKRSRTDALMPFDKSDKWKEFVKNVAETWARATHPVTKNRMIVMEALGMKNLWDIVKDAGYKGRIEAGDIYGKTCSEEDLVAAAKQYGKPFDLVAKIPRTIQTMIEKEIAPRIETEIESSIFPRVITLMFSVLGFLSLIVAVLALVGKLLLSESTLVTLITLDCLHKVAWAAGALIAVAMITLIFKRWWLRRISVREAFGKADRSFEELEEKIQAVKKTEKDLNERQKELNKQQKELDATQKMLEKKINKDKS